MIQIIVDKEKCSRDGSCVAECPAQVLDLGQKDSFPVPNSDFEEVCLRCGHCVAVCPTGAFSLDWLRADECLPIRKDFTLSPIEAEQFLRSRRSIRVFESGPVGRGQIERLIQIACHAPSAKNVQPWSWVIIEDPLRVAELDVMIVDWMRSLIQANPEVAESLKLPRTVRLWEEGRIKLLRNAPHLIIVHVDRTWPFGVEGTALALSYVELYAPVLGLGATWSGYFYTAYNNYPPLAQAVPVPRGRKVVGAMMVGRPRFSYYRLPKRNQPEVEWR